MTKVAAPASGLIPFLRNATAAASLEDLGRVLVEDLRLLVACDRAALVVRGPGGPFLAALGGGAPAGSGLGKGLAEAAWILAGKEGIAVATVGGAAAGLDPEGARKIQELLRSEGLAALVAMPLMHRGAWTGCLVLLHGRTAPPGPEALRPLALAAPVLAGALARELCLWASPAARRAWARLTEASFTVRKSRRRWWIGGGVLLAFLCLPVSFKAGGAARLAPERQYLCYAGVAGTVAEVSVEEGDEVLAGQVLAKLDEAELAFQIRAKRRQIERAEAEIGLLLSLSAGDPARTAELDLVRLQRDRLAEELGFLDSCRGRLEIAAPVSGLVTTERIKRLQGRRFREGEVFCSIAPLAELDAVVEVSEEEIAYVRPGQELRILFNACPSRPLELSVERVAPMARAREGRASVFEVRAALPALLADLRPGMGGVGHVVVGRRPLGWLLARRVWLKVRPLFLWLG